MHLYTYAPTYIRINIFVYVYVCEECPESKDTEVLKM